jgi:competence ComEA-like helix-hairpin-helix protein
MFGKKFIRDYLRFSRRDRIGIISLLCLVLIVYLLPFFYSHSPHRFPISQSPELSQALDSLQSRETGQEDEPSYSSYSPLIHEQDPQETYRAGELFSFDPNTLSSEGWQRLGLPSRTVRTIMNYRNKGGRFRQPSDLQKVWGLPPGFYERVKDHISITPQQQLFPPSPNREMPKPERRTAAVNINSADTSAFIALPGIGSKLAFRIISFRDKLGGFYSVDQVAETFGLPDSTFRKIKPYLVLDNLPVKKLSINTATVDELKSHPYIRWNLAKAIVAYRQQHGKFNSLDELKKISLIAEAAYEKMKAYLEL